MRELQVRNQELLYTDHPYKLRGCLNRIREMDGTVNLPSIIIYTSDEFVAQQQDPVRLYAIIDGNKRALADSEKGRRTKSRQLETDGDLEEVIGELDEDHIIIREHITTIDELNKLVCRWLQYRSGRKHKTHFGDPVP